MVNFNDMEWDSRIIAAFITGIFTLVAVWYSHQLGQRKVDIAYPHKEREFEEPSNITEKIDQKKKEEQNKDSFRLNWWHYIGFCLGLLHLLSMIQLPSFMNSREGSTVYVVTMASIFTYVIIVLSLEGEIKTGGLIIIILNMLVLNFLWDDWHSIWNSGGIKEIIRHINFPPGPSFLIGIWLMLMELESD
ncbi:MAG: hypothetical protein F6K19_39995 [Cyanothece sp. SIO1E1]|nr:hypothetical protein [Cyanothece sp. SIO1E1]